MQVALDGAQPRVALADVLRARQVMLAAEESLRSGRAVALGEGAARAEGTASWVAQVRDRVGGRVESSHCIAVGGPVVGRG